MRLSRLLACAMLIVGSTFAVSTAVAPNARAWASIGCKIASASVHYAYGSGTTAPYQSAMYYAGAAWNATPTPAFFQLDNGTITLGIDAYYWGNTGYDGITLDDGCDSHGHWLSPSSWWNTYYTNGYSATAKKQVMVHELGHVLGLAHSGTSNCSGQPIMYYSSDRYFVCGHSTPQTDDVNCVNALY